MGKVMYKLIVLFYDFKYNIFLGIIFCGVESCKICILYFLILNFVDKEFCILLLLNVEFCGVVVSGFVLEFEVIN